MQRLLLQEHQVGRQAVLVCFGPCIQSSALSG
jgi:hypothetical protein